MEKNNFIADGEIIVSVDGSLFSKEVVLKCLYWYGDKFHTAITAEANTYKIVLKQFASSGIKEEELNYYLQKIERDLVDYHLREIVNKESENIRELLIAKAFSNGEFDEDPPGEISDAVGFDPLLIQS